MTEIENKQSFWKGVVAGVVGTLSSIACLIASGYYFLQIVELLNR